MCLYVHIHNLCTPTRCMRCMGKLNVAWCALSPRAGGNRHPRPRIWPRWMHWWNGILRLSRPPKLLVSSTQRRTSSTKAGAAKPPPPP